MAKPLAEKPLAESRPASGEAASVAALRGDENMRQCRAIVVIAAVGSVCGCATQVTEYCVPYQGDPGSIQERVLDSPPGSGFTVIDCISISVDQKDYDEACLLQTAPEGLPTLLRGYQQQQLKDMARRRVIETLSATLNSNPQRVFTQSWTGRAMYLNGEGTRAIVSRHYSRCDHVEDQT